MSKPHPIARINHSYRLTRSHGAPWLTRQSAGRPLPLRSKGCGRGKSGLGLAELDETEFLTARRIIPWRVDKVAATSENFSLSAR